MKNFRERGRRFDQRIHVQFHNSFPTIVLLVRWKVNFVDVVVDPRVSLDQSVIVEWRVLVLHLEYHHSQRPPVTLLSVYTPTGGLTFQYLEKKE